MHYVIIHIHKCVAENYNTLTYYFWVGIVSYLQIIVNKQLHGVN